MRENLRGLPIDSRYRPTASVASSSIQYCMKSLPDTSTRLPADPKVEMPRLRRAAEASTAMPSAPGLREQPEPAVRRQGRGERGVEPHLPGRC